MGPARAGKIRGCRGHELPRVRPRGTVERHYVLAGAQAAREVLGLATQRRIPSLTSAYRPYLAWHRENVFAPT